MPLMTLASSCPLLFGALHLHIDTFHSSLPWLLALEEKLIDVEFIEAPGGTGQVASGLVSRWIVGVRGSSTSAAKQRPWTV